MVGGIIKDNKVNSFFPASMEFIGVMKKGRLSCAGLFIKVHFNRIYKGSIEVEVFGNSKKRGKVVTLWRIPSSECITIESTSRLQDKIIIEKCFLNSLFDDLGSNFYQIADLSPEGIYVKKTKNSARLGKQNMSVSFSIENTPLLSGFVESTEHRPFLIEERGRNVFHGVVKNRNVGRNAGISSLL